MHAYDANNPTPEAAYALVTSALAARPRRIAVIGAPELVRFIAGDHPSLENVQGRRAIPVFNHADRAKEEVLEWVSGARERGLGPGERETFEDFCAYLGLSPELVEDDLWTVLGPLYEALTGLLEAILEQGLPVQLWSHLAPGESLDAKVQFVDANPCFLPAVSVYKEATGLIGGDPAYWADYTAARGMTVPFCLNGDTESFEEAQVLRAAGWTIVCVGPQPIDGDLAIVSALPKAAVDLAEALSAERQEAAR